MPPCHACHAMPQSRNIRKHEKTDIETLHEKNVYGKLCFPLGCHCWDSILRAKRIGFPVTSSDTPRLSRTNSGQVFSRMPTSVGSGSNAWKALDPQIEWPLNRIPFWHTKPRRLTLSFEEKFVSSATGHFTGQFRIGESHRSLSLTLWDFISQKNGCEDLQISTGFCPKHLAILAASFL